MRLVPLISWIKNVIRFGLNVDNSESLKQTLIRARALLGTRLGFFASETKTFAYGILFWHITFKTAEFFSKFSKLQDSKVTQKPTT